MDRNREARRASIVGSNGFNRRRHRTSSLRDSPDEDGGLELQESVRLRERVKKDRDRERERDRDRDRDLRERERDRERDLRERSSRSKRRRAERLTSGGDETSEESVNDDEDEDDEEIAGSSAAAAAGPRFSSPAMGSISNHHHGGGNHHHSHSSSFSQQQQPQHNSNSTSTVINNNNHHLQHRKTFPPSSSSSTAKVLRAPPPVWKPGDEMISASVPRKARSASTKRSHDWISSSSNNNSGGDQNPAQPSSSPARQSHAPTPTAPPPPPAPTSPSSNTSIRKKLKQSVNNVNSGPKLKPPKATSSSANPCTSNPEELEFEIAEVLYGLMTQAQAPPSKKEESKEVKRSNVDAKSLSSSPISNSFSNNNPMLGPSSSPLSAVAPKRKRPRQVPETSSLGARSSPILAKLDTDQTPKSEISSPVDKISGSAVAENGSELGVNSVNSQVQPAEPPVPPTAAESMKLDSELIKSAATELRENQDLVAKEDVSSSKEQESPALRDHDSNSRDSPSTATASSAAITTKALNLIVSEIESQKEEKFEIDLMAPPPQARSSPERGTKIDLRPSFVVEQKPVLPIPDADLKPVVVSNDNVDEKGKKNGTEIDHLANVAAEEKKCEEADSNKAIENNYKNKGSVNIRLDLDKPHREVSSSVNAVNENKSHVQFISQKQQQQQQQQQQQPLKPSKEEPPSEKPGLSTSSLPLPMSLASWPGGLPPMGYMAPMQGVISVDGTVAPTNVQQPLFSQPRPKRCATHCHIARNIHCMQQFMKMNPFWPPPAGSPASLFTSKPCNPNVVPPAADLNVAARGSNNAQDKGPSPAAAAAAAAVSNGGKDKNSQPAVTSSDSAQRKQQQQPILIQQALPPVPPTNLLGPAFIFPLNQQQQAARPGPAAKSPTTTSSPNVSTSGATSSTSAPPPASMSFNYPNMTPNETQYHLAILQNNAFPFPISTVGAPPNYRGPPAQAMPLFNGSFYPSQIIHQQPPNQQPQLMQAHLQNTTAANNSSSSAQKQQHIQSQQQQQQRPQPNNFPSQKSQLPQHNQYMQQGNEESPSANDSRGSRAPMNIYSQNFAMPIHPQNFAMMTPQAAMATANNSNQAEKKSNHHHQQQQQQQLQQGLKTGVVDSLPPHTFAMSFGPGIDASSMAQSHAAMFQNCPEGARQNIQMMAAAAVAAQKNNGFRISEEGKSGNSDHSAKEDERKSFAFTRSDLSDTHATSSIQPNNVIESSGRSITVGPGPARSSRPTTTSGMGMNGVPNAHVQAQLQQQQQQMMQQLKHHHQQQQHQQQQQQQMAANAVNRANKQPSASNGNMYSEHLSSSSIMGAKFQNTISPFPQNLVQSNNSPSSSPSHSPQWKSSARTPASASQPGPSSLGSSGPSMHKNNNNNNNNLPQQHSRSQPPMHAQISFGGNNQQKQSAGPQQGQAPPPSSSSNQVGSPTTSSMSKGTSGSPRTNSSASTNNKTGPGPHGSSFSTQPSKNPPSILGNPHGSKTQAQLQQQHAQQKNMQQQAQLYFSNPYVQQTQSPHSSTTSGAPPGYYMTQRRPDQRGPGAAFTSSSGVLSLCNPVSLSGTSTNDPATAIAAATCNVKVHTSPFGVQPTGTLLPAGFPYVHPVPAGVQVKPAEQKQSAGNDNLHHQWQPEKR